MILLLLIHRQNCDELCFKKHGFYLTHNNMLSKQIKFFFFKFV